MPELRKDHDVIVHSGDFHPNRTWGIRAIEEPFQRYWVEENAPLLRKWLGAKPFLLCPGNHDFINPVPYLRDAGIDARWISDEFLEVYGVGFYGFPWVPVFGDWNYMASPNERRGRLSPAIELMEQGAIDVFVAHGPMYGVRDRNARGERCGSRVVRDVMQTVRHPPKWFLCGHIHESHGQQPWSRGVTVSNAATIQNLIIL